MTAANQTESFRDRVARHYEAGTCHLCEKPVLDGDARHGATGAHWECNVQLTAAVDKLRVPGAGLRKRRKREGEGATAQKAKELAVAALEAELGATLTEVTLWNQQGVYRGPRWDLDCWGMYFKFEREGHVCSGSASSLATMTQCVKWGKLMVSTDGFQFSYNISQHFEPSVGAEVAAFAAPI